MNFNDDKPFLPTWYDDLQEELKWNSPVEGLIDYVKESFNSVVNETFYDQLKRELKKQAYTCDNCGCGLDSHEINEVGYHFYCDDCYQSDEIDNNVND
jgi:hypothetical protein